jgi:hypothetical protein
VVTPMEHALKEMIIEAIRSIGQQKEADNANG